MTLRIGQSTAYRLISRAGIGGMAELFLAEQESGSLSRRVALKRLLPSLARDPVHRRMFLEEARVVSRLRHPAIPAIYGLLDELDPPALAMEWIDGASLRELEQRAASGAAVPFTPAEVRELLQALLDALGYLAEFRDEEGRPCPLYHRDIAPENILIGADGRVRLVDFGISKSRDSRLATETGVLKGRLAYLPPETARGEPFGPTGDLYSLGLIAVEALTGRLPFESSGDMLALLRSRRGPPELPADFPARRLFLEVLSAEPLGRPQTPAEFLRRLETEWPRGAGGAMALKNRVPDVPAASAEPEDVSLYWGDPTPVLPPSPGRSRPSRLRQFGNKVMVALIIAAAAVFTWTYENRGRKVADTAAPVRQRTPVPAPAVLPAGSVRVVPPVSGELVIAGVSKGIVSGETVHELPSGYHTFELRAPPDRFYRADIFVKPGERFDWKPVDSPAWSE